MSGYAGQTAIFDYDVTAKMLTARSNVQPYYYYSSCLNFLDASNLLVTYSGHDGFPGEFDGLASSYTTTNPSECFRLAGHTATTGSGRSHNITNSASTAIGSVVLPHTIPLGFRRWMSRWVAPSTLPTRRQTIMETRMVWSPTM